MSPYGPLGDKGIKKWAVSYWKAINHNPSHYTNFVIFLFETHIFALVLL